MKKAAVLPALGIGDGLLMMIASHHLKKAGYHVTTFHAKLSELSSWFPGHAFSSEEHPRFEEFDLIVAENDNSAKIQSLLKTVRPLLSLFYPTYSAKKHATLTPNDFLFDAHLSMAENIGRSIGALLQLKLPSKANGLLPPLHLTHRKYPKRVVIHPLSREPSKNWLVSRFLLLAKKLKAKGFSPVFCMAPSEAKEWIETYGKTVEIADCPDLSTLAAFIYESGYVIGNDSLLGHLGSNLNLPTLVIANEERRMRLWRPDWRRGALILPPWWLPNVKGFRLKTSYWPHFISTNKVMQHFASIQKKI